MPRLATDKLLAQFSTMNARHRLQSAMVLSLKVKAARPQQHSQFRFPRPVPITLTVNYATADGVARSTSDYVAQNGMIISRRGKPAKPLVSD